MFDPSAAWDAYYDAQEAQAAYDHAWRHCERCGGYLRAKEDRQEPLIRPACTVRTLVGERQIPEQHLPGHVAIKVCRRCQHENRFEFPQEY